MISERCKSPITIFIRQLQRLASSILLMLLILPHTGCGTQTTHEDPTPPLAPATLTVLPPLSTSRAAVQATSSPTSSTITQTAVLLPTVSPRSDDEGTLLNLRDIPRYPGTQPMPPDKNPVLATLIESIRQQVGAENQLETEAFTLVGVGEIAPERDIELFYMTELTDWQPYPEPRYAVAMPEDGTGGTITMQRSWSKDRHDFTIVVVEMYSQYFLIMLLQSDA